MRKKIIYILDVMIFLSFISQVHASALRETIYSNDGYDTIYPNTFIIGITKFSGDEVITASKAAIAGANDAVHYASLYGSTASYHAPVIYLYLGSDIGWFSIDQNNHVQVVSDKSLLLKLSSQDIYYVNNKKKKY